MGRFKHTGERKRQLQAESVRENTKKMISQAEREMGRSLTADEMRDVRRQAERIFGNADVYGGD